MSFLPKFWPLLGARQRKGQWKELDSHPGVRFSEQDLTTLRVYIQDVNTEINKRHEGSGDDYLILKANVNFLANCRTVGTMLEEQRVIR